MSSFRTHALIGACGGTLAGIAIERLRPELLATVAASLPFGTAQQIQLGLIALSAFAALWPDCDEPGSYISRRSVEMLTLMGLLLGAAAGGLAGSLTALAIGAGSGAIIGAIAGTVLLRTIRTAAGGHRRLTHSLVMAAALILIGSGIVLAGDPRWAIIPFGMAWGLVLHILGDVVTPGGVPLAYPISTKDIRILPKPVSYSGEAIAASTAAVLMLGAIWLDGKW